jgi:hypothetical protein
MFKAGGAGKKQQQEREKFSPGEALPFFFSGIFSP